MSRETPKYFHAPIRMVRIPKFDWDYDLALGEFAWRFDEHGRRSIAIAIPGNIQLVPVFSLWTIGYKNRCGAQWSWDGNEDKPTLRPSLHAKGVWHGYVRNGELVEA